MRRYLVILGIECAVAGAGAIAIMLSSHATYLAPWICLVVGVHFRPMTPVLDDPWLAPLGVILVLVAVAGVLIARRTDIAPSAITGLGAGITLLAFAARAAFITT
jgi:hypothetical protein